MLTDDPILAVFVLCFVGAAGILTAVAVALLIRWVLDEMPYWVSQISYRLQHRRKRH